MTSSLWRTSQSWLFVAFCAGSVVIALVPLAFILQFSAHAPTWLTMTITVLAAIVLSLKVAALATMGAIVLGTVAALAMARRTFPGKDLITLAFILPIALPGIITGIALSNAITTTLAPIRCANSAPKSSSET